MAIKSYPWTANGTGDGTTGGYTNAEWAYIWKELYLAGDSVNNAILRGFAVSGAASPLNISAGAAVVDGWFAGDTAAATTTVSTPAATTGGHVILRRNVTAQTVRIFAVLSASGVTTPPALTQNSTTWEMRLATFTITNAGVITLTDARQFAHFATRINKTNVDGGGGTGRIPFFDALGRLTDAVGVFWDATNARLGINAGSAQTPLDVVGPSNEAQSELGIIGARSAADGSRKFLIGHDNTLNRWWLQAVQAGVSYLSLLLNPLGGNVGVNKSDPAYALDVAGQVGVNPTSAAAPFVLGANALSQLVAGLNADKIDGLDLAFNRQGGSATDWNTVGATNFTPTNLRIQTGSVTVSSASSTATIAVTFPVSFANRPTIFFSCSDTYTIVNTSVLQANQFTAFVSRTNGSSISGTVHWFAIGPA